MFNNHWLNADIDNKLIKSGEFASSAQNSTPMSSRPLTFSFTIRGSGNVGSASTSASVSPNSSEPPGTSTLSRSALFIQRSESVPIDERLTRARPKNILSVSLFSGNVSDCAYPVSAASAAPFYPLSPTYANVRRRSCHACGAHYPLAEPIAATVEPTCLSAAYQPAACPELLVRPFGTDNPLCPFFEPDPLLEPLEIYEKVRLLGPEKSQVHTDNKDEIKKPKVTIENSPSLQGIPMAALRTKPSEKRRYDVAFPFQSINGGRSLSIHDEIISLETTDEKPTKKANKTLAQKKSTAEAEDKQTKGMELIVEPDECKCDKINFFIYWRFVVNASHFSLMRNIRTTT